MTPVLQIDNVATAYGNIKALHGVSVEVRPGEIISLIGSNGAGKSTLLMSLFGTPRATQGRILIDGQDVTQAATHKICRHGVALVPEGRRIFPGLTVLENLQMGTFHKEDDCLDVKEIWNMFPRLNERRDQRAGTLSGGEQQMLAMGRALMSKPKLLLLDEPSLGLAPKIVEQIFDVIKQINQDGTTVFLVEQNANHALALAHRGYVLVNGRIQMTGTGEELRQNPDIRKAYLGE